MINALFSQGDHYRARAEYCRTIANMFQNDEMRQKMLEVAADYERLATKADGREVEEPEAA